MNDKIFNEKLAAVEALLFLYGEPITQAKIAKIIECTEKECAELLRALAANLKANSDRGLMLQEEKDSVQLATKPNLAWLTKKLVEAEFKAELTPAALETLSLIAYLGPIPRSTVDYIRGVNSSFILRALLLRGLIVRELQAGKKNVYEYRASFDFLKHMGIAHVSELPEYEKYHELLKRFETETMAAISSENNPTS